MHEKRTLLTALTVLTAGTVGLAIGCSSDSGSSNTQPGAGGSQNGTAGSGGSQNGTAGSVNGSGGSQNGTAGSVNGAGGGASGSGGSTSGGGTTGGGGAQNTGGASNTPLTEPIIPPAPATCPTLHQGDDYSINVQGKDVWIWAGAKQTDKKGPVFFYFHGTGGSHNEASSALGGIIKEITDQGGIVASFEKSTDGGQTVNNGVWYDDDYKMTDDILACSVQQLNIDTHRIYAGGASAGGLASGTMVFTRSTYLAGAMPNSGGVIQRYKFQDPRHMGVLMTAHGTFANDIVQIHFSIASMDADLDLVNQGGFAVDCEHSGGHTQVPPDVVTAQWTFLKAHPFGVTPEPYAAGLPANFPAICKIVQKPAAADTPQIGCTKPTDCPGQKCCYSYNTTTIDQYTGAKSSCEATCAVATLCSTTADCTGTTCIPTDYASYCGTPTAPIN